jgi:nucleotide-binding universal stress UspA family protein
MRAAAYAAGLARRQNSRLVLVFIQPMNTIGGAATGAAMVQLGQDLATDLERQIREAAERLDAAEGIRWEFVSQPGDAYNGLVEVADRLRADAVVIGASTKAGHRLLGSVGVRLVKSGRWPVTVVP